MAIKINIYNQKAETVGEMELAPDIFNVNMNEALVHQAVVAQMANERQVLAHTKDRGEVRGGGRKPWRQKGTGRARHGSRRSPIWIGGGVTFGPRKDRNFKKKINKKMKQQALKMVLSDKVANERMILIDELKFKEYKTKIFNEMIIKLEGEINKKTKEQKNKKTKRSMLVVNNKKDEKAKHSGRNLPGLEIININNINIFDLLKYRDLVLTKASVKKLEETYKKDEVKSPPAPARADKQAGKK